MRVKNQRPLIPMNMFEALVGFFMSLEGPSETLLGPQANNPGLGWSCSGGLSGLRFLRIGP